MGTSLDKSLEQTGHRVAALVLAKLRRTDIRTELDRLDGLSRGQARLQVGGVVAALFALSLLAAAFGWIGLAIYFVAVVAIFR
jgi:hypothetical protein